MSVILKSQVAESDILRADAPKGEEAEAEAVVELREELEPTIARELEKILAYILAGRVASSMLARADALPFDGLVRAINPLLKRAGALAIGIQAELLLGFGVAVPVSFAESMVAQWANRYDYNLVGGINRNSRSILRRHISQWSVSEETFPQLVSRLSPHFGRSRAALIGSTEATRAFSEGQFAAWEASGFNRRPPLANRPPAHPRCRCFPSLARDGSQWVYVWYTVLDRNVCPICEPRHATVIGFAGQPDSR
jgi:hypothetical protein